MIKVTVSLNGVEITINGNGQHIKGTISQEVGAINSFEFEIFPQNIGYELIQSRKTLVKAINTVTKRVEFAGRVLLAETKMESNGVISKRVTCESYLGYLYDSVQPYADMATMTLRDFLQIVIDNHNNSVESEKRMQLGTVNVEVAGTGNVTKGLQYETTYDTIKSKLVDIYGGELEVVENEGGLTLNYVNQIGTTRATTIELGRNMQAASREVSPLSIITRVIPLGAKIKKEVTDDEGNVTEEETSERLTLVGYAPVAGEPAFSVRWIDDEEKQKECGIVCGNIEFDDVTTQSSLYRKAIEYMQNENLVALSHTLTALDLKEIGQDIDGLNCGDSYPVKNVLIGLDEVLRITKKTIDINAPYKGSITIGEKRATLSSIQAGTNATISELFGAIETIHKATNSLKEHVSSTDKSVNELNTKVEGIEGTFFYIRYSPYSDGHVMTDAPEDDTEYMGTCSTNENKAPTDYKKYTWVRVKGEQGEQGVAGDNGEDGKATYFHVKFSDVENPTTSEQMTEIPSKYIGTYVDYTEADSTDPAKYKWIKFTGEDGEDGLAGENGEDGKTYYLHIKYSNDGGATFTENNGETTGEYIGVYTDTTEADSTETNKYKWSKIKGDKGEAGETGADGKTSYLHIKYSDDGETFTENNGETLGAWIGTYVDFNEYDSTVFSDYTWKKFTEDVDEELEDIRSTVVTLSTDITNNSETISLMAAKEYVETTTYEGFKQTIEENIASLQVENDAIDLKFEDKTTEINDNLETKFTELYKYFKFTQNGLEIRSSDSKITLEIDNDLIIFKKNGVAFGWWDGENFHTGNIVVEVNERAQFGNFAFIPRASGSLSFLKVAGENEFSHTHIYADIITPPTETEQGFTTHLCKLCGESYVDSYTDPTGHIHTYSLKQTIEPNCTEQGYNEYACKCGHTKQDDYINALGHSDSNGDGYCDDCGAIVGTFYTITAQSNNTTYGTASGSGSYLNGSTATLQAIPKAGYHFVQWHDGNTSNPRTVTVTGNKVYTATFAADAAPSYTITTNVSPSGAGTVTGGGTYENGTRVTLTATPNSGYEFSHWLHGGNEFTKNPYSILADANYNITAVFKEVAGGEDEIFVGVTKRVNIAQCVNEGELAKLSDFTLVKFVPTVSGKYQFEAVSSTGDGDTYGRLYNSAKSSTLVSDDESGNGSNFLFTYDCTAGTIYYLAVKFYFKSAGSGTADLLVTRVSSGGGSTKEITIYSDSNGSLRVDCNGSNLTNATREDFKHTFNVGDNITLTFTPDSGYSFYDWWNAETYDSITTANPYTFTVGDTTPTQIGIGIMTGG